MKRIVFYLVLMILAFASSGSAQSKTGKPAQKGNYYISVARCDAGQFSKKQWQQAANKLERGGIPAFFAAHESLPLSAQIRGDWLLIRIPKRYSYQQPIRPESERRSGKDS